MRYAMIAIAVAGFVPFATVFGQEAATQPVSTTAPAVRPVGIDEAFEARVQKVVGKVSYALVDENGVVGEWQPARAGDLLPAGTRIQTQLRSKVVLMFGDDSVVMIDRVTLASIDQFHRSGDTKVVKLGLGHGAIRAGVRETTLRSDMTIETPTAILSKRGTWDFGIAYEMSTGRFRVFLAREGLVQALNKVTGDFRMVWPGQYVTEKMVQWVETAKFDRCVPMTDLFGLTDTELWFISSQDTGVAVADPGGGSNVLALIDQEGGPSVDRGIDLRELLKDKREDGEEPPDDQVINRPEGNFGTGGALLPSWLSSRMPALRAKRPAAMRHLYSPRRSPRLRHFHRRR